MGILSIITSPGWKEAIHPLATWSNTTCAALSLSFVVDRAIGMRTNGMSAPTKQMRSS